MAQKTVLRRLLSKYGFLSIEMMNALADDDQPQFQTAEEIRNEENNEPRKVVNAEAVIHPVDENQEPEPEEQPEDKPDF